MLRDYFRLLLAFFFIIFAGPKAEAQTAGNTTTEPPASDTVRKGGCMPIGLTAGGEVVFPMECKAVIEQQRGAVQTDAIAAPKAPIPIPAPEPSAPETIKPIVAEPSPPKTKQSRIIPRKRTVVNQGPAITGTVPPPKRPLSN